MDVAEVAVVELPVVPEAGKVAHVVPVHSLL
jgi:hypothetical protein